MKEYFRTLMAAEEEITPEARERLVEKFVRPINLLWIWAFPSTADDAHPNGAKLEDMAPWPSPDEAGSQPEDQETAAANFNPFAFNALVIFKREGPDALLAQLSAIDSVENLKRLAAAQHLAIPRDIDEPATLRAAIVEGAEKRLADRRAAGS